MSSLCQLRRTFNKYNIKTTFYTPTTLRSLLSKPKDPILKEDRNNVIYQLDCKDCEAVYVGETKRTLNIRTKEHISAVKSASQRSHTAKHCWKYNHDFDWNNKRVLDFETNWKTRIIKEAIYSEENKHHIIGVSFKLPAIWKPILQKNKEKKNKLENSTAKNTSPSNPSPDTSAMQTNQSAMTTKHFDPPASTYHALHHLHLPDNGRSISRNVAKKQHDSRHDKLSLSANVLLNLSTIPYDRCWLGSPHCIITSCFSINVIVSP